MRDEMVFLEIKSISIIVKREITLSRPFFSRVILYRCFV